jgi:hypothetical protein
MEIVNFQCGHCGKLMAVGQNLLGQQVRCPHCQQVVVAPPTAVAAPAAAPQPSPPPPPAPAPAADGLQQTVLNVPGMAEPESIFTPAEASDVISAGPPEGRVEMPSEPWPQFAPQPPAPPSQLPTEPMQGPPPVEPTLTYVPHATQYPGGPSQAPTRPDSAAFASASDGWPVVPQGGATTTALESNALAQSLPSPAAIRPPRDRGGWFTALVVIPLISYSILATIAVIYLRFYQPTPPPQPHPLEMVPDIEGKNKGAKRQKSHIIYKGRQLLKLPDSLRTSLGQPIRVGDIEVNPVSVEFKLVTFQVPKFDPTASGDECLVLNLRLKNVSEGVVFKPMDPYFDRKWKEDKEKTNVEMPFTYLTIGDQRFFGGPNSIDDVNDNKVSIEGQHYDRVLKPGEEMSTFVCTDWEDPVRQAVDNATGPMLWRIQVRRGLVEIPEKGEYSATAVVGVEFTKEDVKRGQVEP